MATVKHNSQQLTQSNRFYNVPIISICRKERKINRNNYSTCSSNVYFIFPDTLACYLQQTVFGFYILLASVFIYELVFDITLMNLQLQGMQF